jgi:hypothetical protein
MTISIPISEGAARARSILIVEDEAMIAMMLEEYLLALGHHVAGIAACIAEAEALIRGDLHRFAVARHRARHRRPAARPHRRDLRAGKLGQDHAGAARHRQAQKMGGTCAFVDAEHALDPVYARKLGVDVDDLLVSQPDTGEQALEIADTLVRSGRDRRHRHRLGGGPGAARRDRGRDGRQPRRPAGAPDEPGAAQADRLDQQVAHAW